MLRTVATVVVCLCSSLSSAQTLVRDINEGPFGSNPGDYVNYRGSLVFTAYDGEDRELWVSDGTEEGTFEIDIWPGPGSSDPGALTLWGGRIFFKAFDHESDGRPELHVSDGTAEGTYSVGRRVDGFIVATDTTLFFRSRVDQEYKLWTSDGTWAGTVALPVETSQAAIPSGDRLFFAGREPDGPFVGGTYEAWTSDGTEAGTYEVADDSAVYTLGAVMGGAVYYGVGSSGLGIYFIDAEPGGSSLAFALPAGAGAPYFLSIGDVTLFMHEPEDSEPFQSRELWRTDGTAAGTFAVLSKDDYPEEAWIQVKWTQSDTVRAGDRAYFWFDPGGASHASNELWESDGTVSGTTFVGVTGGSTFQRHLGATGTGDAIAFQWNDGVHGTEVWLHDNDGGNAMYDEVVPLAQGCAPEDFVRAGDHVFFTASVSGVGRELYAFPFADAGAWVAEPYGVSCGSGEPVSLELTGVPEPGGAVSLDVEGAAASVSTAMLYSASQLALPIGGGCEWSLGVPNWVLSAGVTDGSGTFSLPFSWPAHPALVAVPIYVQSFVDDPVLAGFAATNGLELRGAP